MKSVTFLRTGLVVVATLAGCKWQPDSKDDPNGVPTDVQDALDQLPDAHVIQFTNDGMPLFIVGEMGRPGAMTSSDPAIADAQVRTALPPVLKAFRLTADDLVLRRMSVDDDGGHHFRYTQKFGGLDVIGGDLIVGVDVKGAITSVNGPARGDISLDLGSNAISMSAAMTTVSTAAGYAGMNVGQGRSVYIQTADGELHKAYETTVTGVGADRTPVRDKVYVDMDSNSILARYPQIHTAESRHVYSANNGTSLPGTSKRTEGGAASGDVDVDAAYDGTGNTWLMYHTVFNRDSYDNAGAQLISSVHYDTNYCNAYWDSTQMVYGDGDPSQGCGPLARSQDVTAHELTHAVTERESGLNYSGESGGMNEAMSDIFGAATEAFDNGGKTGPFVENSGTWLVGETVLPPFLRNQCDPAADGASADVWSSTVGNLDVHYSSGVGNLAACMMAHGGTHPRGKTTVNVPAIGADKTFRIFYKANTDFLTSTSNYAAVRTATQQAAQALGYDQATQDAVGCAWASVKVGTAPARCGGGGGGGGGDVTLMNGVPVTGIGDATGGQKFFSLAVPAGQTSLVFTISGGTGDADMYVLQGTKPTLSSYSCRPYVNGNSETCTVANPTAGTWWVMLNGYATYTGVTLTGTYTNGGGGGGGDTVLTNGVPVTGISGATGSKQYWRINTPAGKHLTISISGGTGDADLYTRFGSRPTTSTYSCRPYIAGNGETCTVTSTQAGDYYIMLRGYAAFTGVKLTGSY